MKAIKCGCFMFLLLNFINAGLYAWKNEGREFGIAFPPYYAWTTYGRSHLVATSQYSGYLFVSYSGINDTYSVNSKFSTVINIPSAILPTSTGTSNKAIYVTANVDIVLYAFNYCGYNCGQQSGFLLYPMLTGESYILHSRRETANVLNPPHAYFTAVAWEDNTIFTVYSPKLEGGYAFDYTFTLNKGQTFCNSIDVDEDYTAVKITSDKKAYITSGHANLKFYNDYSYRLQSVGSVIFPMSMLATEYLIPGIAGTSIRGGNIKVVAASPENTTITLNGVNPAYLKEGQVIEYSYADESVPSYVTCSQPCSVALYTYQYYGANYGGTVQLPIISKDYFASQNFIFTTPSTDPTRHFVSIVVLGTDTSNITFDGSLLQLTWTTITTTYDVYSHATMSIAEGHHLISTSHFIMVYLYGHFDAVNYAMSYGYPVVAHDPSNYNTVSSSNT